MSLSGIPGQQRAVRFLKQLLGKGAIPHALLFSGMEGTGKLAAAMQFARALNCQSPQDHDSCGACGSCHKMEEGLHPDVLQVRSEGAFIKVDQVRDVVRRMRFRPFEGKYRVVIIEDAPRLMEQAANALLKILEEPPEANVFILLSVESQMLLPTIVSRCCQVRFQPLGDELVADWLVREGGLSPDQAQGIARLAAGSIGRARLFSDGERAANWRKVIERLENLGRISMLDFFPMVADWAKSREAVEQDLEFIKLWVRDIIIDKLTQPPPEAAANVAGSPAALFLLYHNIELAVQGLKVNANLQMTLERVCLAIKDLLYGKGDWNSFPKGRQGLPF